MNSIVISVSEYEGLKQTIRILQSRNMANMLEGDDTDSLKQQCFDFFVALARQSKETTELKINAFYIMHIVSQVMETIMTEEERLEVERVDREEAEKLAAIEREEQEFAEVYADNEQPLAFPDPTLREPGKVLAFVPRSVRGSS